MWGYARGGCWRDVTWLSLASSAVSPASSEYRALRSQVLEMWGYNIAARNLGIRHTVMKNLQVEPQG